MVTAEVQQSVGCVKVFRKLCEQSDLPFVDCAKLAVVSSLSGARIASLYAYRACGNRLL